MYRSQKSKNEIVQHNLYCFPAIILYSWYTYTIRISDRGAEKKWNWLVLLEPQVKNTNVKYRVLILFLAYILLLAKKKIDNINRLKDYRL